MNYSFLLPLDQESLRLRALVDRTTLELFFADGRAAYTTAAAGRVGQGVYVATRSTATAMNLTVFDMGCGWAQ